MARGAGGLGGPDEGRVDMRVGGVWGWRPGADGWRVKEWSLHPGGPRAAAFGNLTH